MSDSLLSRQINDFKSNQISVMKQKIFFSPGKVILSGEHSVVYGQPALVSSIDLGVKAEVINHLNISKNNYLNHILSVFQNYLINRNLYPQNLKKIDNELDNLNFLVTSNLPSKSGLGSSSAYAHAIILALIDYLNLNLSKEEIFDLVYEAEKFVHNNPSGVDASAVVFSGTQVFKKINKNFEREKIENSSILSFRLINSGRSIESTGEMVNLVKNNIEKSSQKKEIINKIGMVTNNLITSIVDQKFDPSLLSINQRLLEKLGVVGKKAKKMVKEIESIGGFAKITGAGGIENGSGLLLVYHLDDSILDSYLARNPARNYKIQVN